jgi:phosphonopyruvate decarboxylase
MIGAHAGGLVPALDRAGIGLVAGVPCSFLAGPLLALDDHPRIRYVPAANEGAALSVAAGSWLAGTPSAVLAQNSGFGNLINPLTSLVMPYRIPVLIVVSMRGWPGSGTAEPQHEWMGRVVPSWLDTMDLAYRIATPAGPPLEDLLDELAPRLENRESAFLLVTKGAVEEPRAGGADAAGGAGLPTRRDLVEAVLSEISDEFVLATTGYLSRELYLRGDRDRNIYIQGAMGHVASVALGATLASPGEKYVVLDGDGAFLMHLGAICGIAHFAPSRFVHVVFDNGGYESTGGQPTGASAANLAALALAAGYHHVQEVDAATDLRRALRVALRWTGPGLLFVRGTQSQITGGRASNDLPVDYLAQRFRASFAPHAPAKGEVSLRVSDHYPDDWRRVADLPLFATWRWHEVMAGRIEGAPHWFWSGTPDARPGSAADSAVVVGFAGSIVGDPDAYVWGNPPALVTDPRSPLMTEATRTKVRQPAVSAAELLPCLSLTFPGYASFPVGGLAGDLAQVETTLREVAGWAAKQDLASVALPYAAGGSPLAEIAHRLGWEQIPITTESCLEIADGGFAGHISRLPGHRRRRLAAERQRLHSAGVTSRVATTVSDELLARLVELRCNQRRKYGVRFDRTAEAERLTRFISLLGDQIAVFLVESREDTRPRPDDDPRSVLTFSLFARDGQTWHGMYVGTDYSHPLSRNGYFEALFYAPLDAAQGFGVRRISYGHSAGEAKLLRGCTLTPVVCLMLGLTPGAVTAARIAAAAWRAEEAA